MGAHWLQLANTTERPVRGGDAALCQITLATCYVVVVWLLRAGGGGDAVWTVGEPAVRDHVTTPSPLVTVAMVISAAAVLGGVVLTVVVRWRHRRRLRQRNHSPHHQLHAAAASKQAGHVTAPFVVTSHPAAAPRHAGYDRVAPLIAHTVRYQAPGRPS